MPFLLLKYPIITASIIFKSIEEFLLVAPGRTWQLVLSFPQLLLLLRLGPYSCLGEDAGLLLLVVVHLLQVGHVPELHPEEKALLK